MFKLLVYLHSEIHIFNIVMKLLSILCNRIKLIYIYASLYRQRLLIIALINFDIRLLLDFPLYLLFDRENYLKYLV